ncbi:hypothetical protein [Lactococcus fujiensis]|uniref:hypothetical protein n=1 Tax=Lactococcus fujiensis TaxID=610251 RepID=UPI000A5D3054|nr:hypothetical protein [Lactococcus fujiensis]
MTGDGIDQNKRLPMQWAANGEDSPKAPVGATEQSQTDGGSVAVQEKNPNSLLIGTKKVLRLKAKYPEIASSRITNVEEDNTDLSVINYGNTLTIINNFSSNQTQTIQLPKGVVGMKLADQLVVTSGQVILKDGKLTLPAYSTAILRK